MPVDAATADNGQWIVKWCDYSNKYGLGYQLADGSCGVLFNDMTKMVLAADEYHVESIERDSSGNRVTLLTLSDYPEELTKKVTLLKYFRSYMSEHLLNVCFHGLPHPLPYFQISLFVPSLPSYRRARRQPRRRRHRRRRAARPASRMCASGCAPATALCFGCPTASSSSTSSTTAS